jgi:hypothetical protein
LYSAWTSSERLRRALEIIEPEIQTYGTAGFSNLPLVNQPSNVEDVEGLHIHGKLRGPFCFSRVQPYQLCLCRDLGILRLGSLVDSSQFHDRRVVGYGNHRLTLDPSSEAAADAAEAALRSIDLTKDFAGCGFCHEARVTNDAPSGLLRDVWRT